MTDIIDCAFDASPLPTDGDQKRAYKRSGLSGSPVYRDGRRMGNIVMDIQDPAVQERQEAGNKESSGLNADAIKRFLDVAARGRSGAASGGEQRAQDIAAGILPLIDHLWGLDSDVIEGLCELIRCGNLRGDLVKGLLAPVIAKRRRARL
jgi:hypothetical protein